MKLVALLFCVAALSGAQEFQIWQAADAPVIEHGRVFGVLHTQFRTRPNLHDYYQARVGPIVRVDLSSRVTLVGGYYFGEVEQTAGWGNNHRLFTGVETPVSWKGQVLGLRTMVERHLGGEDPPNTRIRQQLQIVRRLMGPVAAIMGVETFFDQKGFFQQRTTGGVRLPFIGRYRLDVTYIYDARVERAAPSRHVIQTAFKPRRREH